MCAEFGSKRPDAGLHCPSLGSTRLGAGAAGLDHRAAGRLPGGLGMSHGCTAGSQEPCRMVGAGPGRGCDEGEGSLSGQRGPREDQWGGWGVWGPPWALAWVACLGARPGGGEAQERCFCGSRHQLRLSLVQTQERPLGACRSPGVGVWSLGLSTPRRTWPRSQGLLWPGAGAGQDR